MLLTAGSIFQPASSVIRDSGAARRKRIASTATELDGSHETVPVQCLYGDYRNDRREMQGENRKSVRIFEGVKFRP